MNIEPLKVGDVESKVIQAPGMIVLDFYQATCPPCRVLEPRLERIAEQYKGRVPVYRVDIDRDLEVAERFNVKSIPTLLVVQSGKRWSALTGL
jgi:thioredoxin-like negative regulator of GroEL